MRTENLRLRTDSFGRFLALAFDIHGMSLNGRSLNVETALATLILIHICFPQRLRL